MFFTRIASGQKKPERHSRNQILGLLGGNEKLCPETNWAESPAVGSTQCTTSVDAYTLYSCTDVQMYR